MLQRSKAPCIWCAVSHTLSSFDMRNSAARIPKLQDQKIRSGDHDNYPIPSQVMGLCGRTRSLDLVPRALQRQTPRLAVSMPPVTNGCYGGTAAEYFSNHCQHHISYLYQTSESRNRLWHTEADTLPVVHPDTCPRDRHEKGQARYAANVSSTGRGCFLPSCSPGLLHGEHVCRVEHH